jgi:hypothetical protein
LKVVKKGCQWNLWECWPGGKNEGNKRDGFLSRIWATWKEFVQDGEKQNDRRRSGAQLYYVNRELNFLYQNVLRVVIFALIEFEFLHSYKDLEINKNTEHYKSEILLPCQKAILLCCKRNTEQF